MSSSFGYKNSAEYKRDFDKAQLINFEMSFI